MTNVHYENIVRGIMPEKRFRDMYSDDPALRQRYLDDHGGQAPDNFIEGNGGGINMSELKPETFGKEQAAIKGLEDQIRKLKPGVYKDGEPFRW